MFPKYNLKKSYLLFLLWTAPITLMSGDITFEIRNNDVDLVFSEAQSDRVYINRLVYRYDSSVHAVYSRENE